MIAREYIERFVHHSQIRRAVSAPELDGALVSTATLVAAQALARWLVDYTPVVGTSIAIGFE